MYAPKSLCRFKLQSRTGATKEKVKGHPRSVKHFSQISSID